mmetsp:Transcript_52191/g.122427  ORF Transcript_52191/g.122427 Transcript_52191/m.122427 type:complete len:271 (+) Transcript_52191:100-912(+)
MGLHSRVASVGVGGRSFEYHNLMVSLEVFDPLRDHVLGDQVDFVEDQDNLEVGPARVDEVFDVPRATAQRVTCVENFQQHIRLLQNPMQHRAVGPSRDVCVRVVYRLVLHHRRSWFSHRSNAPSFTARSILHLITLVIFCHRFISLLSGVALGSAPRFLIHRSLQTSARLVRPLAFLSINICTVRFLSPSHQRQSCRRDANTRLAANDVDIHLLQATVLRSRLIVTFFLALVAQLALGSLWLPVVSDTRPWVFAFAASRQLIFLLGYFTF